MENNFFQHNNPKRQKLLKPLEDIIEQELPKLKAKGAVDNLTTELKMSKKDVKNYIQNLEQLKACLLTALQLELSTIPPYLCGLYTIKEGSNVEAAALIRSVAVEEMLHMILVANILNAITDPATIKKGEKLFNVKDIIPVYPTPLPGHIVPVKDPSFKVQLLKFSTDALDEYITIESPSDPDDPFSNQKTFDSIGQFYQAIRYGLARVNKNTPGGIFKGDPKRQVTPEHYYGSGGKIIKVENYEDAKQAIEEIVGQGEGVDGTIVAETPMFGQDIEYAHYFKFREILFGRMYSANDTNFQMPLQSIPTGKPFKVSFTSVYNMKANPKMNDYKNNPELLQKAIDFNKSYVTLLNNINDAVSGDPDLLVKGTTIMYELKYQALALLNIPIGNGECAGPTFEYVEL